MLMDILEELGSAALFFRDIVRTGLRTGGSWDLIMAQVASVSIRSLPTVAFAGVFVGAIIVLQFNTILAAYDAQTFLGGLNSSAIIREVGPLIISFLLAGKVGAYTAAELGTMRVTEQIDAVECLGTDPIQYLIIPRFFGIVLSTIILLGIGLVIIIAGSMAVANYLCGINPLQFATSIPQFTSLWTLFCGLFKSMVYGFIVALVSCHQGFTASGGAKGVGKAVTRAAIYTNFYIVLANYLVSDFLRFAYEVYVYLFVGITG